MTSAHDTALVLHALVLHALVLHALVLHALVLQRRRLSLPDPV